MAIDWSAIEEKEFFFDTCTILDKGSSTPGPYGNPISSHVARDSEQPCRKEIITISDLERLVSEKAELSNVDFRVYFPGNVSGLAMGDMLSGISGETGKFEIVFVQEVGIGDTTVGAFSELTGAASHVEVLIARDESR